MLTSAFTCTGPYAVLIMLGIKRVENRSVMPVTGAEFAAHCQFAHENFQALHSIAQRIDRNVAFMVEREKRDLTDHVYCWEALEKPRREQVKRVWDWMMDPKHANHDIWTLSRACDEVFSPAPGNYPTSRALYDFCHAHDAEFY